MQSLPNALMLVLRAISERLDAGTTSSQTRMSMLCGDFVLLYSTVQYIRSQRRGA